MEQRDSNFDLDNYNEKQMEEGESSNSFVNLEVDLSQRYVETIPLTPFVGDCAPYKEYDRIISLNLSTNRFIHFPLLVCQFKNLRRLDISNNQLASLPKDFSSLKCLTQLSLRNNLLECLPFEFQQLKLLEELNISGNLLEQFPFELLQLKQLRILYMGGNLIEYIPAAIAKLKNLKILYVGGNRLIAVPDSIGALSELTSLGLADNRLESIPSSIANLHKLTTLSLHNNKIKVLPPGIARLKNLEQLSLRNNPLVTDFVNEILLEPPTLKELAARIVKIRFSINIYRNLIPLELVNYLNTANQCVNPKCKGVYFESCSELVKFVDFCGKYRVPLLHYLCSSKCSTIEPAYAYTSSSSAESDDDQRPMSSTYAKEKMKKVLLG
uniref:Disease resistance R13L4/SHOC-2-like LRR domain-containing protein n=1 Tax=Meloidogyne enterolobii TaxID=390850 RepID=A0A6V7VN47_MELEN|nr:unnamed protein product [Meloidogyne enterolobii]